jgi:hypothetical protein
MAWRVWASQSPVGAWVPSAAIGTWREVQTNRLPGPIEAVWL